jgi:S-DNA-T family DNA segregation ATPase FtsK/SpoIIIE
MAGKLAIERAAATHRRAAAIAAAAQGALAGYVPRPRAATEERGVRELAERLRVAAALLAPGWLGAPLDAVPPTTPMAVTTRPELVRIGTAYPLDDASFPVVVPLGHLGFDGDARDPRVAGALRAILLRLLATVRTGSLRVRSVDPHGLVCGPFAPLHDAGVMPPPVIDRAGLLAALTEAEQWVRTRGQADRALLLLIASWPQATEAEDFHRLSALAAAGPAAGVHAVVGGWPPPALEEEPAWQPLPHATQVTLRNPFAVVGDPPGGSFATPPLAGLNAPVFLDEAPPADLVARVCRVLAGQAMDQARLVLGDLIPDSPLWTRDASTGLAVAIGRVGDSPVTLHLTGVTPHWLIVSRSGAGKTSLLLNILYGLSSGYSPEQVGFYLLDLTGRASFADFVPSPHDPSFLPHAQAVVVRPDPAEVVAVLRHLAGQLAQRSASGQTLPRLVCLVDGAEALPDEAIPPLTTLAERGGGHGVHLILAAERLPPAPVATHCRVRIALPGGAEALDRANQSAAALALGTAVVNTASGLGGPRGATRAHEQLVRFPDPFADPAALAGLRHRIWRGGGP